MKDKGLWSRAHTQGLHPSPGCLGHMTHVSIDAFFFVFFRSIYVPVTSQKTVSGMKWSISLRNRLKKSVSHSNSLLSLRSDGWMEDWGKLSVSSLTSKWQTRLLFDLGNSFPQLPQTMLSTKISIAAQPQILFAENIDAKGRSIVWYFPASFCPNDSTLAALKYGVKRKTSQILFQHQTYWMDQAPINELLLTVETVSFTFFHFSLWYKYKHDANNWQLKRQCAFSIH